MKKKKVLYFILFVMIIAAFVLIALLFNKFNGNSKDNKKTDKKEITAGSKMFKNEYEQYNNIAYDEEHELINLEVPLDVDVNYISGLDAASFLKKGTGVLFFCVPTNQSCRNAIPVLLEVAKENKVDKINYINIENFQNTYEVVNGTLTKTVEEQEGYYDVLKALDSVIENKYIVNDIDTNEKRILSPTFIFVKNGEIIGTHFDLVELNENQTIFDELTKKQVKDLKQKFNYYFEQIYSDFCDETC